MTKSNLVFDYIYNAIRKKEFKSGQVLTEREIASKLGVSRTPIREAFQRLEQDGIVQSEPHKGVKIISISLEHVKQLYQVREVLEGLGAKLLAEKNDSKILSELEELLTKAEDTVEKGNIQLLSEINAEFHRTIASGSGNIYLENTLQSLQTNISLMMSTTLSHMGRPEENLKEHRFLLDALKSGNAALAEEAAKHHVRNAYETALKELRD